MKIAAVHMDTILADVNANMENAKKRIQESVKVGAELVLLPEFFYYWLCIYSKTSRCRFKI